MCFSSKTNESRALGSARGETKVNVRRMSPEWVRNIGRTEKDSEKIIKEATEVISLQTIMMIMIRSVFDGYSERARKCDTEGRRKVEVGETDGTTRINRQLPML